MQMIIGKEEMWRRNSGGFWSIYCFLRSVVHDSKNIWRLKKGEIMKRILIKYTAEIDNAEYDRICKKKMIGNHAMHEILRDVAQTEGLIAIRKKIQEV